MFINILSIFLHKCGIYFKHLKFEKMDSKLVWVKVSNFAFSKCPSVGPALLLVILMDLIITNAYNLTFIF